MAYDEDLARRIGDLLDGESDITQKRMFGGLAFLAGGRMAVAATSGGLMARIDPAGTDAAAQEPGVEPFEMRGRPLDGWLLVAPDRARDDGELRRWVDTGVAYARSLPPKG